VAEVPVWEALDRHFCHHAQQVDRFRRAGRGAVRRMWARQRNERGKPLLQFERFRNLFLIRLSNESSSTSLMATNA
jgi:hypothetical protein